MNVFTQWPIYLIGRILPAAIGFIGIAIYTRLVDPASFGTYAVLLSTAFFVGATGFSWLRIATLRMMATIDPSEEADFVATIVVSFAATAAVVGCIVVVVVHFYDARLPPGMGALTAFAAIASAWFEMNITMSQARLNLFAMTTLALGRSLIAMGCSLAFIAMGLKAAALLGGFAVGNCAALGATGLWRAAGRGTFRRAIFLRMLRFGWPSSAGALSLFSSTFQRYLLAAAGGNAAVGVYAAANDFSQQTVGLLIGTATLAGQPLAYRARDNGSPSDLLAQMRNNARLIFAVGFGSTVGLIALAGPLSTVYLGSKFQANAQALISISALMVFVSAFRANYFEQAFEIALDTKPTAIITALRIVLTVILSLVWIGPFGAVGAVTSLLVAEIVAFVVSVLWARRIMPVPLPLVSFGKIALAAIAMVGAMSLVPDRASIFGLCVAVAVGIIAFFSVLASAHVREVRELLGRFRPVEKPGIVARVNS